MIRRIAYLIPHTEAGGGERMVLNLVQRLDAGRFTPFVILPRDGGFADLLRKARIQVALIPFKRALFAGYPPGFSFPALSAITRQLREWKADLFHLNDSYLALLGGLAARQAGIAACSTAHGAWDAHFLLQDVLHQTLIRRIWAATDGIREALLRRHIVSPTKVRRIYFGVDLQRFKPAKDKASTRAALGLPVDGLLISRVARFDLAKDYLTFFQAMEQVVQTQPRVRIMIVGDTLLSIPTEPASYKRQCQDFVNTRPLLKERVTFLGQREDVPDILAASDLLVSSSISEGAPFNIVEAMASGLPVVSTAVGSIPELLGDATTGSLVPPRDASQLADAVLRLLSDAQARERIGAAARRRAEQLFNVDDFVRLMQDEYDSLMPAS